MPELGSAIGPSPSKVMQSALEQAVEDYLRERGDSAQILRELLVALRAITDQLAAAASQVGLAAGQLATVSATKPPVVNVLEREQEAPIVTVDAPVTVVVPDSAINVTISEPPEPPERGVRKRVIRDRDGLITEIIEEPL